MSLAAYQRACKGFTMLQVHFNKAQCDIELIECHHGLQINQLKYVTLAAESNDDNFFRGRLNKNNIAVRPRSP